METVPLTPNDLTNLFRQLYGANGATTPNPEYKYVIYSRKSTDEKDRQLRSLGDQILECQQLALDKSLKTIGLPIKESESAKEPDIRPKFRQMLNDLKDGKYDGIIAWHPDRLARNMKEAGEIIDLIDKNIIKDLQFKSFTFENSTSGKMLLGIAFVLSKQYSDQLSDNVRRGNRRSIEEGKYISKGKHGYYKDRNQFLRPDGDNFTLIKGAWRMRLEGKTLREIADYLNQARYTKAYGISGQDHKSYRMDPKRLSGLFRDPFYAGVLVFGKAQKTIVDLTKTYDLVKMIEVEEFLRINKFDKLEKVLHQKIKGSKGDSYKADLLRGIVICEYCGQPRTSGITPKKSKSGKVTNYFYYRCDTPKCKFYGKSTRAKFVVNFVYDFLDTHKFTSKEIYDHYIEEMKQVITDKNKELNSKKRGLLIEKRLLSEKVEKTKDFLLNETDEFVKDTFKTDLKSDEKLLEDVLGSLIKISELEDSNKGVVYSYEQFLELFDNMPVLLRKTKSMKEKDFIIRKIFLNFILADKEVTNYRLNPPFDRFVKEDTFPLSRGAGN
ncbi:MAG TPA: recombinase family protein [Candidatus Saccharimonadales bacterium]|nr:recombinase family protein [Candidatus Saccharimonadales bacterium]